MSIASYHYVNTDKMKLCKKSGRPAASHMLLLQVCVTDARKVRQSGLKWLKFPPRRTAALGPGRTLFESIFYIHVCSQGKS